MISVSSLRGWATASNDRAVANARGAAIECSRRRVERAEVTEFLAAYAEARPLRTTAETAVGQAAAGR